MADDAAEQAYAAAVEEIARVKAAGETQLDLSGDVFHALSSIPPQMAELTALTALWLNDTPISELKPLSGLKNLKWLILASTQIGDLTPLAGLTNLERLWLTNTPVTDLTPLVGLEKLRRLDR